MDEEDCLYFKIIVKRDESVSKNNIGKDTDEIVHKLKRKLNKSKIVEFLESQGFALYEDVDAKEAISDIKITNCETIKGVHKFLRERETKRTKKLENECINLQSSHKGTYIIITFKVNRNDIDLAYEDMSNYFFIEEDLDMYEDGHLNYDEELMKSLTDDRLITESIIVRKTPFPMPVHGGSGRKRNTKRKRTHRVNRLNRKSRKIYKK